MQTLSIPYPDSLPQALHLSNAEFEREARMAMSVKLFDSGRLTSGQAAELAGMARVHFLMELGCVLKLATEKKTSHSEEQKGKEGRVGFVVTCGNSPHSLDFLKEIFHLVS